MVKHALFTLKKSPYVINLVSSIHTSTDDLVNRAMLMASTADEGHDVDVVQDDDSNAEKRLPFAPAITSLFYTSCFATSL